MVVPANTKGLIHFGFSSHKRKPLTNAFRLSPMRAPEGSFLMTFAFPPPSTTYSASKAPLSRSTISGTRRRQLFFPDCFSARASYHENQAAEAIIVSTTRPATVTHIRGRCFGFLRPRLRAPVRAQGRQCRMPAGLPGAIARPSPSGALADPGQRHTASRDANRENAPGRPDTDCRCRRWYPSLRK
jgi:hypothetical protein